MELCDYLVISPEGKLIYLADHSKQYEVIGFRSERGSDPTFNLLPLS